MKEIIDPSRTFLNHGYVFSSDLETEEKIRNFLLKSGAVLIYQKHCTEKNFIKKDDVAEAPH